MQRIGIIDLGSNTVRLVVFDVRNDFGKRLKPNEFAEVLNEKAVAGLSAYVVDGIFTDEGIEKAVDVLNEHVQTAQGVDCKRVHVFATAVLRNCANSAKAVKAIEKATDLSIDIISGEEEAHLGFVGATIKQRIDKGVLVDIGGGSTEFTHIERGRDLLNVSIPQGSVSSYASYVSLILPTHEECERIQAAFAKQLAQYKAAASTNEEALFGIGGSVRAVAKMLGRMHGNDKAQKAITLTDVDEILRFLEDDESGFAHLAVKAAPDRLHSMVPGCLILREVMRSARAENLTVCKYGIREGYLYERILKAN